MDHNLKQGLIFNLFLMCGYAFEETPCAGGRAAKVQRMLIDRLAFEERWNLDAHESAIPRAVLLESPILLIGLDSIATCSPGNRVCWIDGLMDGRLSLGTEKREAMTGESFHSFLLNVAEKLDARMDNPLLQPSQSQSPAASSRNSDFDAYGRLITVPLTSSHPEPERAITRCRMNSAISGLKSVRRTQIGYAPPDDNFLLALKRFLIPISNTKASLRLVVPYGSNLLAYSYVLVISGADRKFYKLLRFTSRDLRLLGEYAESGNKATFDRLKAALDMGRTLEQEISP